MWHLRVRATSALHKLKLAVLVRKRCRAYAGWQPFVRHLAAGLLVKTTRGFVAWTHTSAAKSYRLLVLNCITISFQMYRGRSKSVHTFRFKSLFVSKQMTSHCLHGHLSFAMQFPVEHVVTSASSSSSSSRDSLVPLKAFLSGPGKKSGSQMALNPDHTRLDVISFYSSRLRCFQHLRFQLSSIEYHNRDASSCRN